MDVLLFPGYLAVRHVDTLILRHPALEREVPGFALDGRSSAQG